MSQRKVDAYKQSKKTRKQDVAKQKRVDAIRRVVAIVVGVIVGVALLVGIGVSIYNIATADLKNTSSYVATSFLLEDISGIQPDLE